jgi:hypothetical protein
MNINYYFINGCYTNPVTRSPQLFMFPMKYEFKGEFDPQHFFNNTIFGCIDHCKNAFKAAVTEPLKQITFVPYLLHTSYDPLLKIEN